MEKNERKQYKQKIELYEKLGAVKFQKVVFAVERIKFKVLKTVCPNFIKYYDKYCDYKKKKAIDKATSEEEVNQIIDRVITAKTAMRKEFYQEKNRNYHMDNNYPTEIIGQLEWNKNIHKKGLIFDSVAIPILTVGTIMSFPGALPLLAMEVFNAGINFQCINIQNRNICRYKLSEDILTRKQERDTAKRIEKYSDAHEVIAKTIIKKEDVPVPDEVLQKIEKQQEIDQLREALKAMKKEREIYTTYSKEKPKQLIR